jgi:hypothetical protein
VEILDERRLLAAASEPGDIPFDYRAADDQRISSDHSIQQQKFLIVARKGLDGERTGYVTYDRNGIQFSRDKTELLLRVDNNGLKGASVSFQPDSGSASFSGWQLPATGRIPANDSRRLSFTIPQNAMGTYSGTLTLLRDGVNAVPLQIRIRAVVAPEASLSDNPKLSADATRVFYDFTLTNTGTFDGLTVTSIKFLDGASPAFAWRAQSYLGHAPIPRGGSASFRIEADIHPQTTRNITVVFETNGSNGAVSQSINLQAALDRLPPVLNVRKYTETESIPSKSISLPFRITNDSIREVLVVEPSQIQVIDQYGDDVQSQLIKSGFPTTAIVLLPGETRSLTFRLDIDKPFGTTERFRWTSIRIQSNGGNREATWNLNHLIDRLPARLEFDGFVYKSWTGSSLQYAITLKNDSIRDELIVDLSETELPQHVTIVSPTGPLRIAPGKTATITISIFTDLPDSERAKLVRFTVYFDSNDPRGKRGITINAKSLE